MSADALVKKVSACVACPSAHPDISGGGHFCALDGNKPSTFVATPPPFPPPSSPPHEN